MNKQKFEAWFKKLKYVWEQKKPDKILDICANDFVWHETPFKNPYTSKEELPND